MKKFILFILITLIIVGSFGCVNDRNSTLVQEAVDEQANATQNNGYTIALVMKTLTNPFFVDMENGARKAENEFGIRLIVRTAAQETSIEQQIQIVEELILQKVNAIVIAPGSSVQLVSVLKKAQDAGIKIVNIDNRFDPAECEKQGLTGVPFISVRNDDAAYQSTEEIIKLAKFPCEAMIIEGIKDAENSQLRVAGAKKGFSETEGVELVALESADWKIDEAYELAKRLFSEHPNVKLVFAANDMMALGVVQYLKESNRKDVLLAGFDNLDDARQAIKDGWMQASIDQQADVQGYMGVKTAINMIEGVEVEAETYIPIKVITDENIE